MSFEPEIFVDISPDFVPGILPYYMISNYGRIWHKYKAMFLTSNIDSKGYMYKPLATINGNQNFRIHRLVALHFIYIPGCEEMLVNHKDGIKTNCYVGNLEWVNYSENGIHAYSTGLIPKQNYDDEIIIKVCEMLQDGNKTFQQISDELQVSYQLIQAINQKRVHCDISDNYVFKQRKINANFTENQIRSICKYIENNLKELVESNSKYCARILMKALNINNPSTNQLRAIEKVLQKKSYTYISENYNF